MITFFRKNKIAVITLVVIVVALILGAIVTTKVVNTAKTNATLNSPVEQVNNSSVGKAITNIIPKSKNASSMVAPATSTWWDSIGDFVPAYNLSAIKFNDMPVKPKELGWSITYSDANQSDFDLGLNAVFVTFGSKADAEKMQTWIADNGNSKFQTFAVGNVVVLAPSWASTQTDFLTKNYAMAQSDAGVTPNKGYWKVDFNTLTSATISDENKKVYNTALSNLGFNPSVKAVWYASSSDGVSWNGNLTEGAWTSTKVDSKAFEKNLQNTTEKDPASGGNSGSPIPEGESGDYQYTSDPKQSTVLGFVSVQTSESSFGYQTEIKTGDMTTPKKLSQADSNLTKFSINPNAWFAMMNARKDVPNFFNYDLATITLDKTNTNMSIDFTKAS